MDKGMNEMMNKDIVDIDYMLKDYIDEKYSVFSSVLIPGASNILGIRIPILRKIAKEISKGNWSLVVEQGTEDSFESIMLKGMIIGFAPLKFDELKRYMLWYLPKISNWSLCDGFCVSLKISKKYKIEMFDFIQQCLKEKEDYTIRFGLVMLLTYYVEENYLEYIYHIVEEIDTREYYVMMAAAWLLATCYTKYTDSTYEYLMRSRLDNNTLNKSIQKIAESQKISIENKNRAKNLKRRSGQGC